MHLRAGFLTDSYFHSLETARDLIAVYRVVLLQKSTLLYPRSALHGFHDLGQHNAASASTILQAILSGQVHCPSITSQSVSIQTLCALSILASHTGRLPGSLARRDRQRKREQNGSRADLFELYLHKWLHIHARPPGPDADTVLLYHLIHFSIYIDLGRLSQIIREYLTRQVAVSQKSFTACFMRDEYREKATWHAHKILDVASQVPFGSNRQPTEPIHLLKRPQGNESIGESIHYTHAVYSAAMILWCAEMTASQNEQSNGMSCPAGATQILHQGMVLLHRAKARVAEVYAETMQRLLINGVA